MLVIELTDEIEFLLEQKPDKRKKQEYKTWLTDINKKIAIVNELAKFKLYAIIH